MRRENFLILLGALVLISPFAGLPLSWLAWILPILGVLIIVVGIMYRRGRAAREMPRESAPVL